MVECWFWIPVVAGSIPVSLKYKKQNLVYKKIYILDKRKVMEITLVEKHQIKYHSKEHKECDKLCFLSKNLYNSTLYAIRQHYFNTKRHLSYPEVNKQFASENQSDYRALPAKVALWTQKLVDQNFKSFFALLESENYNWKPKIPKYLHKTKWRQMVFYYNQALSYK